jgi:dinuclear metal center YbgI/SA1388 family protein
MPTIADVVHFLEEFAPASIAEEWDNVGLLVGDREGDASRVMTCLTVTEASAAEAIGQGARLIVTHHPLPFRPVGRIATDSRDGRLLWQLIRANVSVYSPHTAFDSAVSGINARLASELGLRDVGPLVPRMDGPGAGRHGELSHPLALGQFLQQVKQKLGRAHLQYVGDAARATRRVGIACGSGGDFVAPAAKAGCDVLLTGEARFHACLEAESLGLALILAGHYATERFGIERLAEVLAERFPDMTVWASRDERDPIEFA